jgi:hypothetical protein
MNVHKLEYIVYCIVYNVVHDLLKICQKHVSFVLIDKKITLNIMLIK